MDTVSVLLFSSDAQALRQRLPPLPDGVTIVSCAPRHAAPEHLAAAVAIAGYSEDIPMGVYRHAPKLRWIHLFNIGLDKFLDTHAVPEHIALTNSRGVGAGAMADHALMLMLAFSRSLVHWVQQQQRGLWERAQYGHMVTLEGRTIGILGFGAIGRQVARRARGFGMRVLATRRATIEGPQHGDPDADALLPMDAMLAASDFVVIAAPLTAETNGLVNADALQRMKPTAYLINLARGRIVVETALVAALAGGRLAGAGLDVFETEPLPAHSPLWTMPNVVITPHVSAGSTTVMDETADLWSKNLEKFIAHEPLLTLVTPSRGY